MKIEKEEQGMNKQNINENTLDLNLEKISTSMYVANMLGIYRELYDNGFVSEETYREMLWRLADLETENL